MLLPSISVPFRIFLDLTEVVFTFFTFKDYMFRFLTLKNKFPQLVSCPLLTSPGADLHYIIRNRIEHNIVSDAQCFTIGIIVREVCSDPFLLQVLGLLFISALFIITPFCNDK